MILVVDDHADTREALKRLLTHRGYEVETAADGAEALAFIHHAMPDLMILDENMPRMSGMEFLRCLRDHPGGRGQRIPVIFYSAEMSPQSVERAGGLGVDHWVSKGVVGWDQLLDLVRTTMDLTAWRGPAQQDFSGRGQRGATNGRWPY